MGWFKKAAPIRTWIAPNFTGKDAFFINGKDALPFYNQLKQLSFSYDKPSNTWSRNLQSIIKDPSVIQSLQQLNIPVDQILAKNPSIQTPKPQLPIQPQQPTQSPQIPQNTPQNPTQPSKQNTNRTWILAKNVDIHLIEPDQPVVVAKIDNDSWEWMSKDGYEGVIKTADIRNKIASIKDAAGKSYYSNNPKELFDIFNKLFPSNKPTKDPNAPKGRIPDYMINSYQKAVETTLLTTGKNIMMDALAGCTKTSTLLHLSSFKKPEEKWLYLVFNKKNQIEGKEKFPPDVNVRTSHSFLGEVLGTNADKNIVQHTELWSDKGTRFGKIVDDMMEHDTTFPFQFKYSAKKVINQLGNLAKHFAINPQSKNVNAELIDLAQKYHIDMDLSTENNTTTQDWTPMLIEKTIDSMFLSLPGKANDPNYKNLRDHDDSLWYAALSPNLQWPKFDVVLADEVQDFNKCQIIMLRKLKEAGARIIAVGDLNQACYFFRGADAHAFPEIKKMIAGDNTGIAHELPVNYRSGTEIINYINKNTCVNNLKAGMKFKGLVTDKTKEYVDALADVNKEYHSNGKLDMQTAFIARTNKPLVEAALSFLQQNIDFSIIGRDFSQELIGHIEKIVGKGPRARHVPIQNFANVMSNFMNNLENKWAGKISKAKEIQDMREFSESLISVLEYLNSIQYFDPKLKFKITNTFDFIEYLRKRFSGVNVDTAQGAAELAAKDKKSFVTLATAHRSKGLEFDRIFIVEPNLFPHPKAEGPEELEQEAHLKYISYSRGRRELHVLKPKPQKLD